MKEKDEKFCECTTPRDMGWLDSMYDELCGTCEKKINYKERAALNKEPLNAKE